ncbi:MAG: nucleotidyltransferase family protein [Deltaproteobacteria bacterium]|nr:nucleotidyltransferase family protein [Deltaproteobacteria bacterium]
MKKVEDLKRILKEHKNELKEEYGISEIGLFGSCVAGEQKDTSDIDVLIEFQKATDLISFVHLKNYLSDLLDANVDLVMKRALKPEIRKMVLREVVYI